MLNVTDNEILLFKHEVEEYNKIEIEIKNLKLKMKPIQDRIKELLNYKKEKQTEVLSFMEKNDLDVCNTNSGTIEMKQSTHVKAIKKADVYDRLFKFFTYDSDKIHGMSSEEKAKFLHNYIYVEDREKSENKSLKCKM
jgi:putative sterol carrier protein